MRVYFARQYSEHFMYVTSSSAHSNLWGGITHILQIRKYSKRDNTACLNHRYSRSYAKI